MKLGIVDLFAGIGGVANGFQDQGDFELIALVDTDPDCQDTYLANYPKATYLKKDVRDITARSLLDIADGRRLDGIVGCPPCQGFSAAGSRNPDHPMNRLVDHYFRLVRETKPRFLVMENVPNILLNDNFQRLTESLRECGYNLWVGVLNAALYGVPQIRQRAIVIGYRKDTGAIPIPPEPSHFGTVPVYDYASQKLVQLDSDRGAQALGVYPSVEIIKQKGFGKVPWLDLRAEDFERLCALPNVLTLEAALGDLPKASSDEEPPAIDGHVAWKHTPDMVKRLKEVPAGGKWRVTKRTDKGLVKERYFSQAYARLHPRGLGYTISTYFHNPGSGRYVHYNETRCLTVREAARLQTISDRGGVKDGFVFPSYLSTSERLIGNAFPTLMAKAIASAVARALPRDA